VKIRDGLKGTTKVEELKNCDVISRRLSTASAEEGTFATLDAICQHDDYLYL